MSRNQPVSELLGRPKLGRCKVDIAFCVHLFDAAALLVGNRGIRIIVLVPIPLGEFETVSTCYPYSS